MKQGNEIWTLSANYLSGEMTDDQSMKFIQMIERKPDLKLEFENIQLIWNNLSNDDHPESNKSWERLHNRLNEDGLLETQKRKPTSLNYILLRVAAIIIFGLIMGGTIKYFTNKNNLSLLNSSSITAVKNVNSYTLPDGSSVFLNKGSRLYYSDNFGENRKVKLKGEGFFEVMSDPENPFLIETRNAIISVLGTKFNVKENQNTTEVLVESGKVQLQNDLNSNGIILSTGEFGKSEGESVSLEVNTNVNYLSWKTREFEFVDKNLQQVLEVLEESYQIEINIKDIDVEDLKLTSTYSQQSIDAILQTICVAFDFSCNNNNKKYTLRKN
ncbi:MAG: FecR family protein [Bacteroidales bacterium]|nr:FecR family protein [Bacteroidales bacterium]